MLGRPHGAWAFGIRIWLAVVVAFSVDLIIGGMLWGLKGQAGKLERTNVTVGLGKEWASHQPFGQDSRRTTAWSMDRLMVLESPVA